MSVYNELNLNPLLYITLPKKKIRVVMLCTPNYTRGFAGVSSFREYAKKNGYEFKLYQKKLLDDLHINFTKMEIMRRECDRSDVDYTVLFDADTEIKEEVKLENIIELYPNQNLKIIVLLVLKNILNKFFQNQKNYEQQN